MKSWVLFILGTLAYFLMRYGNRKDKSKAPSITFWFKDNWTELSLSFVLDLILMILIIDESVDITIWLQKFIPEGLVSLVNLAIPAICGLGLGWGAYEFVKKFIKRKSQKVLKDA